MPLIPEMIKSWKPVNSRINLFIKFLLQKIIFLLRKIASILFKWFPGFLGNNSYFMAEEAANARKHKNRSLSF